MEATNSRRIHSQERQANVWITPHAVQVLQNWNYYHSHSGNITNGHTSRTCAKPGPVHNPHTTRTNMMNGSAVGLHKMILPLASGHATHVPHQQRPPAPASWQQPLPPIHFTTSMPQMMPFAPYYQMHYMGRKFGPTHCPIAQPAPPVPAPPEGTMMMPYYASYPQPHPF